MLGNVISSALWAFILVVVAVVPQAAEAGVVHRLDMDEPITQVTVDVLREALADAEEANADAFIIVLDTEGGLLAATRDIVKLILNADVPVVVYVGPRGAHAASAGMFITVAADVAAMAPGTNIGAAHPVGGLEFGEHEFKDLEDLFGIPSSEEEAPVDEEQEAGDEEVSESIAGGESDPETLPAEENVVEEDGTYGDSAVMSQKVMQDTLAWVRGIARQRDRSEEYAVAMVEEAISLTEEEALENNVIDLTADDFDELLGKLDGMQLAGSEETLNLGANPAVVTYERQMRHRILGIFASPELIALLLMAGVAGIYIEFQSPGAIFPGAVGVTSLLLFLYASQILPVNYLGVALIVAGGTLFVLEMNVPSFGLLTLGGTGLTIFGAMMLFDGTAPGVSVGNGFIIATTITMASLVLGIGYLVASTFKELPAIGNEALIGKRVRADQDFENGEGVVFADGEIWRAESDEPIEKGQYVEITEVEGLRLKVRLAQ